MNKINQRGMDLIQYKTELIKDYPKLVKDSLCLALEKLVETNVLDMDTYLIVKDDSINTEQFEEFLYSKPQFFKTDEEIFQEFEVIRNDLMKKFPYYGLHELRSESLIEKDAILVIKKFCINEAFTMNYFGVEEKDLLKLMKRKGFVEKFAVLRLPSIFKPFIATLEYPSDLFKCDISLVYYDKEENGYSIDLWFELPITKVEIVEEQEGICEAIQRIVEKADSYYESKVVA